MEDIRLYIYENGTLVKPKVGNTLPHKYDRVERAEGRITLYEALRDKRAEEMKLLNKRKLQYVIVKYTGAYQSEIVKII